MTLDHKTRRIFGWETTIWKSGIWGCKKQTKKLIQNTEKKIIFEVVQIKFSAMHITNQKFGFGIFTVEKFTKYLNGTWSLLNILMIFGIKEKTIILTHAMYWKWKWHTAKYGDPYSEFVLYTFPSKCTHTHQWTHTRSNGQPFMLRRPGSNWRFGALLKGTSPWNWRWKRALYIHSPSYNLYRPETQTRNLSNTSPTLYH